MGIPRNVLSATTNENIAAVIQGSAIFSQDDLTFLYRTPSSAGNRKKYSFSFWCRKNSNFEDDATVSESTIAAAGTWSSGNQIDELDLCAGEGTHSGAREKGSPHFSGGVYGVSTEYNYGAYNANRDGVGWQHYVIAINTDAAAADRIKVWVNGEVGPVKRTGSYPTVPSSRSMMWNNNSQQFLLGYGNGTPGTGVGCFDGYVCEFYHFDNQYLTGADLFGFRDPETNQWRPKKYEGAASAFPNNRGDIWSSVLTAPVSGFTAAAPAFKCFDGDATNSTLAGTNNATGANIIFTPATTIAGVTKLRVYMDHSTSYRVRVNGGSWAADSTLTSGGNASWRDLTSILGGTTITSIESDTNGANNGVNWSAIEVNDTILLDGSGYGINGFYLPLDGQTAVGADQSGRGNNWTSQGGTINFSPESPSGISGQVDTNAGITTTGYPTSYSTLDFTAYEMSTCADRKEGGLYSRIENSGTVTGHPVGEFAVSSGKWYYEWIWVSTTGSAAWCALANPNTEYSNGCLDNFWKLRGDGGERDFWLGGSLQEQVDTSADYDTGDTIGVAIDMDEGKWYVSTNGTWQDAGNGTGNPEAGTGYVHNNIKSAGTGTVVPYWGTDGGSTTCVMRANFGQKPFGYAAPKGFLPMCVPNLPSTESVLPSQHYKSICWTGTTANNIKVEPGFTPDLVICKSRTQTYAWKCFDSVRRGADSVGNPAIGDQTCYNFTEPNTNAATSNGNSVGITLLGSGTGFLVDKDGQSIGEAGQGTNNMVGYCWKAGGFRNTFNVDGVGQATASAAGLDGGSVNPTAASVGTESGFSMTQFTATGSNMTIAHGLKKAPEFFLVKGIYDWGVYHKSVGATKVLWLNENNITTRSTTWQDTAPTSSVISMGSDVNVNNNTSPTMVYAWHSVPGLSSFGTYCGTGIIKGQNVFCGFKPALVWIKDVSNNWDWYSLDSARDTYNTVTHTLSPNQSYVEGNDTTTNSLDFTPTGFKVRGGGNTEPTNNTGDIFVYAAWADTPLNNAYGVVATGR